MTKKELLDKAIYIQYPLKYDTYKTYQIEKVIHKLPLPKDNEMWANHYIGKYHRDNSLPLLAKLLNFNYDENDFTLREKYVNGYEISSLIPKNRYIYEICGFNRKEHLDNIDFNELIKCDIKNSKIPLTEYHKQYKYPHENSRIINKTIDSNRKLFISGDSQMIPDIPVLSCYFKEIWYADNRDNLTLANEWEKIEFSDVIVELNCGSKDDYLIKNLK